MAKGTEERSAKIALLPADLTPLDGYALGCTILNFGDRTWMAAAGDAITPGRRRRFVVLTHPE